jgi:zinc protease
MMRNALLSMLVLVAMGMTGGARPAAAVDGPELVTLDAASPLLEIRILLRVGSAYDPPDREGLASLTANALLEGGFGDPAHPVRKEDLAALTRAWGEDARPSVRVAKEATTFRMRVPAAVLDEYLETVLTPLFSEPLFLEDEVSRLANEAVTHLTGYLRYEAIEMLGLEALDDFVFDGTTYGHTTSGSVQGLRAITADDVRRFRDQYYTPARMIVGVSTVDGSVVKKLASALTGAGHATGAAHFTTPALEAPRPVEGRRLVIVAMPDAGATGIHLAFPIDVNRTSPDYWPLYVANVYFGTHRDGHGLLYTQIRQERGYNYGDYSYVEHFAGRPFSLFPPFNTPRQYQYFSIWIRPVATEYAHHLLKASVWELENLVRKGITDEDVERAKQKAKVLYLNLAENSARLLEAKTDDAYYGMEAGYLETYLDRIDAVTPQQVNAAIHQHLQADDLEILMVTDAKSAEDLAEDIRLDRNHDGKSLTDYQIVRQETSAGVVYDVPEAKLPLLARDAVWSATWLDIPPDRIEVVPVERLFEVGRFLAEPDDTGSAR